MLRALSSVIERYRKWQTARRDGRVRDLIALANDPRQIAERKARNEREFGRLALTEVGFRLDKQGKCTYVVQWDQIVEIQTYKLDFWSFDMVCLGFRIGADEWVEAWESMPGFLELADRMKIQFPSVPDDWWEAVVVHAFACNQRTLWMRADG